MGASALRKAKKMDSDKSGSSRNTPSGNTNANTNVSSARPLSIQGPPARNPNQPPAEPIPNQPRQPSNMQGLLRFAMQATQSEDAPGTFQFQPLDEERKRFLNDALSAMTINVIEELQKSIKILSNVVDLRSDQDPSEHEAALERIADFVDNIDVANDFYKIGGFSIFGPCLNSSHSSIRWRVADIMAELAQNNPFCQQKIMEAGLLPILLEMVDSDPCDQARIKALYAVSCLLRGNPTALKFMDQHDGYSVLMRAIQSNVEKLQIKSAFLLSSLCNKEDSIRVKETLVKMGLITQIAALLAVDGIFYETRVQLLSVLSSLTNNYLPALRECRKPELNLKRTLDDRLRCAESEDSVEEADMCKLLLDTIFSDTDTDEER